MTFAAEPGTIAPLETGGGYIYAPETAAASASARPVFLVPGEDILIVVVDLPLPTPRQRAAALPFAVEDLISEPLSGVHVALGAEIAPRRHIAAIVGHAVMRSWIAALPVADAAGCRIVPDVLAVPVPDTGWAVMADAGRAVVRCSDGSGFALEVNLLPAAWRAAGSPAVTSYRGSLPADMGAVPAQLADGDVDRALVAAALDLRQGVYAPRIGRMPLFAKWAAGLLAAGAAAHMLVAAADVMALNGIVSAREAEARGALARLAPDMPATGDVVDLFNRIAPGNAGPSGAQFLPLMARTSKALQPFAANVSIQNLAFAAADGSLGLTMEGPDLATLQAVEQALADSGLDPVSGPATSERGAAEFRVTVHAGGAPP